MKNKKPSIAIILPAYNEEITIEAVIKDFHQACPEAQIVVIDNNSGDKTSKVALKTFESTRANGVLLFEKRKGKANAVRRAFHSIEADIYVMADADNTYRAQDLEKLIVPVLEGRADMVVGDRHTSGAYKHENKRRFHELGNWLVRFIINKVFNTHFSDVLSGYRVFSRRFVKTYPILINGFELETDLTLHALDKRMEVLEMAISYFDRPEGSHSKLNTFWDGMLVLYTIMHIMRHNRPMMFFGCLSVFIAVLGLITGTPAILDYIVYQYVYHVPLAILASTFELIALLLLVTGLILDSIARFHRMDFELKLLSWSRNDAER